ncbi:unnamed protein product [Lactuca virosa]|uniref:Uncharacterized protein n=1 Tax=Lactuca virosa TaxID=75947 RepID=A0AAU9M9Z6_9ASTR|nr:unnamed protein product [Lactuca virosa]
MIRSFWLYHLNNTETTLTQLQNLLRTTESGMKKNQTHTSTNAPVLAIGKTKGKKRKGAPK